MIVDPGGHCLPEKDEGSPDWALPICERRTPGCTVDHRQHALEYLASEFERSEHRGNIDGLHIKLDAVASVLSRELRSQP